MRLASLMIAAAVVLGSATAAHGQEPTPTPTVTPASPSPGPTPSPTASPSPTSPGPAASTTETAPDPHARLRDTVADAVRSDGRLPLDAESLEDCPADAVDVVFTPVPVDAFTVGGFVEPLIEPTTDAPDRATGIATCRDSAYAVAGFDAFLEDEAWTVHFVSPLVEPGHDHDHDEAPSSGDLLQDTSRLSRMAESSSGSSLLAESSTQEDSSRSTASTTSAAVPSPPSWPSGMSSTAEALSSSDPQDTCDSDAKPGALALADLLTQTYGTTRYSISRDCSLGGRSEHKEGRAVDWMVDAYDSTERQMGDQFTSWLLGSDPFGNDHAGMRRLGIMYMIWNRQSIYSWAVDDGWRAYTGSSPHDDHVHFSMTWPGARCQTSFWEATDCTGDVVEDEPQVPDVDGEGGFEGDGYDDIFWYGPGSSPDNLWFGEQSGFEKSIGTDVGGTYEPLVGDFDADGHEDILWYGPGSQPDNRWDGTSRRGQFDRRNLSVGGTYRPVVGDFDDNGHDDVFWYGVGSRKDSIWFGSTNGWRVESDVNVGGVYKPVTGDFDGNGHDDIFWYAPGTGTDWLWSAGGSGTFTSTRARVDSRYTPLTGDFDADGYDDIFWYRAGSAREWLWSGARGADFTITSDDQVAGTYRPFSGDFDDNGADDIFWYGVNGRTDWVYYGGSRGFSPVETSVGGDYRPIATN